MKLPFPWVALGTGLLLALLLMQGGALHPAAGFRLPLLTQLIVAEFGFFRTAIGAGLAVRDVLSRGLNIPLLVAAAGCGLLSVGFLWLGLQLWPGSGL